MDSTEFVNRYEHFYEAGGFQYHLNIERWRAWVSEHYVSEFSLKGDDLLIDLGCGDGFWSFLLAEHVGAVTGVDRCDSAIRVAREKYSRICSDVEFIRWDANEFNPEFEGRFDLVFVRGISHLHQPDLMTLSTRTMLQHCMSYASRVLISLWTDQSKANPDGRHFMHTEQALRQMAGQVGEVTRLSRVGGYINLLIESEPDERVSR